MYDMSDFLGFAATGCSEWVLHSKYWIFYRMFRVGLAQQILNFFLFFYFFHLIMTKGYANTDLQNKY